MTRGRRRPVRGAAVLGLAAVLLAATAGCGSSPRAEDDRSQDAPASATTSPPPTVAPARPLAVVYRGPAACDGCPEAAQALLERNGFSVRFIGPDEELHFGPTALAGAAMYVQPGGSNGQEVSTAWKLLQRESGFRPELIRDYVRGGGRYLGLCMGGYLAGDPGYDLLPGDSGEYIKTAGATVTDDKDHLTDVTWRGHRQPMYFQDGPYFDVNGPGTDVLARYTNDRIAAVVAPYGTGRVAVSGPHPEAPADWYTSYHLPNVSQTGLTLGDDLLHTLMSTP
ncbi:BPL-N domain-containing protein [Kitasatospora sp. NPDC048296]|uniref:BPL-N domain-containing protein n=1 Tax=Kitasatospora sp. NPDC048296 TaxID=3364048 RepID=UPI00371C5678